MTGTPSAGGRGLSAALAAVLVSAVPVGADILPPGRRTAWNPGIPGGIPVRTTICATIQASTYGNGTIDATSGIQAAINACPAGQVVQLSAGDFLVNGADPITIDKGISLRGAGPAQTRLKKTSPAANPLILVGERWLQEAASVNLTADGAKGATTVQVTSAAGFAAGQLVALSALSDPAYVYWGTHCPPGDPCRGWFSRYDRPVGQIVEIASVSGNTLTFTTPLHIDFDTQRAAQVTRYTIPYGVRQAGVEDLYVRGGQDDNITVRFAAYSWVKNVESDFSIGDSVGLDASFRCVLRDSYLHDTPEPFPGGAGYMLSFSLYTADSLVENNILINANKVMVMRASGGGNVVGYNYFDNGFIGNYLGWMETGMNASHMAEPHFELFEGNQAFNIDGDDTWGGAVYITYFRNHATGKRRSYADLDNRRAIGLMYGHYFYSFVGNVLGTAGQSPAPYSGFTYEDFYPWGDDPVPMWRLGYTPEDWNAQPESQVLNTVHRHANFDYATNTVRWQTGYDTTLPDSLYLTARPPFFGTNPWPWVDATGPTKLFVLPARARYDGGNPVFHTLTVTRTGTGSGTVTSTPAGIDCGATCSAAFLAGTVVTLGAAPAAGSTFAGWSGACTGTGPCVVTMTAARAVTAAFTATTTTHPLTVTRAGAGSGVVTSSPAGINCGGTCSASFNSGTVVTLTATPAAGSTFGGWTGDCTGTGACQVTMTAPRAVTATFNGPASAGPVAAWSFDDGSGSVLRDSSPNGNHGTLVRPQRWVAGRHGGALNFNGSSDRVRVPGSPSLRLSSQYTLEAWVYPSLPPSSWRTILQKEVDAYFLTASGGGPGNHPTGGGTFNGTQRFVAAPAPLPARTWTHLAATYDGAVLRVYRNGTLVASAPVTGAIEMNDSPLWLGGNAVYGEHFRGRIDDARVYARALSAAEIQSDMNTPVGLAPALPSPDAEAVPAR